MTDAELKPGAIYCSNCIYYRDNTKYHQVLGSIDAWGRLIVKRVHNMNTVIQGAAVLTLFCDICNYATVVHIETQINPILKGEDYETAQQTI